MRALTFVSLASLAFLAACGSQQDQDASVPPENEGSAIGRIEVGSALLRDKDGTEVGTATLAKTSDNLSLALNLKGLPPGEHALHFHTRGLCEGPDFKTAGGHLNPEGNTHGKLSPGGKHLGDLPNVTVAEDGTISKTLTLGWAFDQVDSAIFDEDGTAIMLHEGPDDYKTDPAGAAGPRIACGVLTRTSN